jgi:hypothetical protein
MSPLYADPLEKISPIQRTLLVADEEGKTRLPIRKEIIEGGWIRAVFDAVSLAAWFGSLGYKVKTRNLERMLQRLPENGETALAGVPNANR